MHSGMPRLRLLPSNFNGNLHCPMSCGISTCIIALRMTFVLPIFCNFHFDTLDLLDVLTWWLLSLSLKAAHQKTYDPIRLPRQSPSPLPTLDDNFMNKICSTASQRWSVPFQLVRYSDAAGSRKVLLSLYGEDIRGKQYCGVSNMCGTHHILHHLTTDLY